MKVSSKILYKVFIKGLQFFVVMAMMFVQVFLPFTQLSYAKQVGHRPQSSSGNATVIDGLGQAPKGEVSITTPSVQGPEDTVAVGADEVNLSSGSFSYSVPIDVPAGSAGIAPSLALTYDSRSYNTDSYIGIGWDMTIPYIKRLAKSGTDTMYDENNFTSSLSGELTELVKNNASQHGAYGVKNGYGRYQYKPNNTWQVTRKSGLTYIYGQTDRERLSEPYEASRVKKWMLSEIRDQHDNSVVYHYEKDGGDIYPQAITWGGQIFKVSFSYEYVEKDPLWMSATAAYRSANGRLLKYITVSGLGQERARYDFEIDKARFLTGGAAEGAGYYGQLNTITISDNSAADSSKYIFNYSNETAENMLLDVSTYSNYQNSPYNRNTFTDNSYFGYYNDALHNKLTDIKDPLYNSEGVEVPSQQLAQEGCATIEPTDIDGDKLAEFRVECSQRVKDEITGSTSRGDQVTYYYSYRTDYTTDFYAVIDGEFTKIPDLHIPGKFISERDNNNDGIADYVFTVDGMQVAYQLVDGAWQVPPTTDDMVVFEEEDALSFVREDWQERFSVTGLEEDPTSLYLHDITGDGYQDVVVVGPDPIRILVYRYADGEYSYDPKFGVLGGKWPDAPHIQFYDFNGDNRDDIFDGQNIYLNRRTHHSYSPAYSKYTRTYNNFRDLNQDGLLDIVPETHSLTYHEDDDNFVTTELLTESVLINSGSGFVEINIGDNESYSKRLIWPGDDAPRSSKAAYHDAVDQILETQKIFGESQGEDEVVDDFVALNNPAEDVNEQLTVVQDFNNDGIEDLFHATTSNKYPGFVLYSNESYQDYSISKYPLLSHVITPTGQDTEVTYKRELLRNAPVDEPQIVVDQIIRNVNVESGFTTNSYNSTDQRVSTSYDYTHGYQYFDEDEITMKNAGFHIVTATNSNNESVVSYFHQGDETDSQRGEYNDSRAKVGLLYRQEIVADGGHVAQVVSTKWSQADLGSERYLAFKEAEVVTTYSEHSDTAISTGKAFTYDTAHGEKVFVYDYGYVQGELATDFEDKGNDLLQTKLEYVVDGVLVRPSRVVIADQSDRIVSEERYEYDHGNNLAKGLLTRSKKRLNTTDWSEKTYTYTKKGNLKTHTDPNGNITTLYYDPYDIYPRQISNPLNQIATYTYHYGHGKPARIEKLNKIVDQYWYDYFSRPVRVVRNGIELSNYLYELSSDQGFVVTKKENADKVREDNLGSWRTTTMRYNGLGLPYEVRDYKNPVTYTKYGDTGEVAKQGITNLSSAHYDYDSLGRVIAVTSHRGIAKTKYDGLVTVIIDPEGNKKEYRNDHRGNLSKVIEYNGSKKYETKYAYTSRGELKSFRDAEDNIRLFTYDLGGRMTVMEELHHIDDDTYNEHRYTYDAADNVMRHQKPTAVTEYTYDELDRVLTRKTNGKLMVDYLYDGCWNGDGKVCAITTKNSRKVYTYDPRGYVARYTHTINDRNFSTVYESDALGNQIRATYPDGTKTHTAYYKGRPANYYVNGRRVAYASHSNDEAALRKIGLPTVGIEYRQAYKVMNPIQVNIAEVHKYGVGKLWKTRYTYNGNDLITLIADTTPGDSAHTASFDYDDLGRLKTYNLDPAIGVPVERAYTYSPTGNMLSTGVSDSNGHLLQHEYVMPSSIEGDNQSGELIQETEESAVMKIVEDQQEDINEPAEITPQESGQIQGTSLEGGSEESVSTNQVPGVALDEFAGGEEDVSEVSTTAWRKFLGLSVAHAEETEVDDVEMLENVENAEVTVEIAPEIYEFEEYVIDSAEPEEVLVDDVQGVTLPEVMSDDEIEIKNVSEVATNDDTSIYIDDPVEEEVESNAFIDFVEILKQDMVEIFALDDKFILSPRSRPSADGDKTDIYIRKDLAGEAVVDSGDTRVKVVLEEGFSDHPVVVVTPTSALRSQYWIEDQEKDSFTIVLHSDQESDVTFNWYAYGLPRDVLVASHSRDTDQPTVPESIENFFLDEVALNEIGESVGGVNEYTIPQAVMSIGDQQFQYDQAGNLVRTISPQGQMTSIYDNENRQVVHTTESGNETMYTYDEGRQRTTKVENGVTTYYISPDYEEDSNGVSRVYMSLPEGHSVEIRDSEVYYHFVDQVGSSAITIDDEGDVVLRSHSLPFGEVHYSESLDGETKVRYALHEKDSNGQVYMNARYYAASTGQFTSPDPAAMYASTRFLADPQQLNHYAYARNNPVMYNDPTGQFSVRKWWSDAVTKTHTFHNPLYEPGSEYMRAKENEKHIKNTVSVLSGGEFVQPVANTWDPVTNNRILELDPRVQRPATNLINRTEKELGVQLRIAQGYRSLAKQQEIYNIGRTPGDTRVTVSNATPGLSYHNYGLAIDVVEIKYGKAIWDPLTEDIGIIGESEGFDWGGRWKGFVDRPHFEMSFDKSVFELLKQ